MAEYKESKSTMKYSSFEEILFRKFGNSLKYHNILFWDLRSSTFL